MSSQVFAGDTSGSITIQAPAVAGTGVLTLPANTTATLATNGPAFSAYPSAAQTITNNVITKIQNNTKVFDTNSNYDNVTNYRFTPTVAGYYQVIACIRDNTGAASSQLDSYIYKNGSAVNQSVTLSGSGQGVTSFITALISMNGTTDFLEQYVQQNSGSNMNVGGDSVKNFFQAYMVRGA